LKAGLESRLLRIFQQGICLKTRAGLPVAKVLQETGFSRKYLEEKVQTVFLDGSAVDDLDLAIAKDGSVIALSAAMPGLAGAILRKGSPISALRSKTSTEMGPQSAGDAIHVVKLKLFNTIAKEMGPELLHSGILLGRVDFENFLAGTPDLLKEALLEAELDGAPVSPAVLLEGKSIRSDFVVLEI
jgi:hypothetical protein